MKRLLLLFVLLPFSLAADDFRLTKVEYESDGLRVFAYVYAPAKPAGRLPVVIFNRGSYVRQEFSADYADLFDRFGRAGFVVIAPALRGSAGAAGRDEMGGADLDDLMNVTRVIATLPYADRTNVFLYGESRGGIMTYQAIRDGFAARAAAVFGAITDLDAYLGTKPDMVKVAKSIWSDYDTNRAAIVKRRSALQWPEKLTVPLLIMHGGSDRDVPPAQALALATRLEQLGREYELIIRAGETHTLGTWSRERDAHAIEWFLRHVKDGEQAGAPARSISE